MLTARAFWASFGFRFVPTTVRLPSLPTVPTTFPLLPLPTVPTTIPLLLLPTVPTTIPLLPLPTAPLLYPLHVRLNSRADVASGWNPKSPGALERQPADKSAPCVGR